MHIFEVYRDMRGRWRARRDDGLVDGLFVDRMSAVRFARRENPGGAILLRGTGA
jgi:hypothetical protein